MKFSELIWKSTRECIFILEKGTIKFSNVEGVSGKRIDELVHEKYIDIFTKALNELEYGSIDELSIEMMVKSP